MPFIQVMTIVKLIWSVTGDVKDIRTELKVTARSFSCVDDVVAPAMDAAMSLASMFLTVTELTMS